MRRRALVVVAATLGLVACAGSGTDEMPEYPAVPSLEEVEALPEDKIKQLPAIGMWRLMQESEEVKNEAGAFLDMRTYYVMVEALLCELKYYLRIPTGERTHEFVRAIRDFQSDIGAEPTGILTWGQMEELGNRIDLVTRETVMPAGFDWVYVDSYSAEATGTWTFEGNARPIQTSSIKCYRQMGICIEALAYVDYQMSGAFDMAPSLNVEMQEWEITSWRGREVVAELDESRCAKFVLTLDGNTDSAIQMKRKKRTYGCEGIAEEPLLMELERGFDVYWDYKDRRQEESNEAVSSRFWSVMETLGEEIEASAEEANPTPTAE